MAPRIFITGFVMLLAFQGISQDVNLDSLLDAEMEKKNAKETQHTQATFKTSRLIDGHTVETTQKGVLDLKVSHRFGMIGDGLYKMFGLDEATMRIGADYGITDRLTVGVGRSTFQKQYDGFLKYRLLWQSTGNSNMPVSVTLLASMMLETDTITLKRFTPAKLPTSAKLSYAYQVMIARKFSPAFSLQIMPTMIHKNLVDSSFIKNDLFAIGVGARLKLTQRSSINVEYFYQLPDHKLPGTHNTLSFGYEVETGGHVFQFHVTNSIGMTERTVITENYEKFSLDNLRLGFNIARVFTIVKPKNVQ